ncbi:hypothetical protein acsn021_13470 [Anaerocolumna cellulosilytica]|uniref:Uncharacterized protein n=1 Tax=Anaerocolumna cellulosilytica TaxID=433286 RepID=A0A6S6R3Z6_9FIRM|nr:hypothetical protein acsn021_13470 [Anaerocolumna cellulosilytica]
MKTIAFLLSNEFVKKWKSIWVEEPIKFSADTLEDLEMDEKVEEYRILWRLLLDN